MTVPRRALVIGVTGQDGSYLAERLLARGYTVFGTTRPHAAVLPERLRHLRDRVTLVHGDLADRASLAAAIEAAEPDEIYNLGGVSFVPTSWEATSHVLDCCGLGPVRLLETIRDVDRGIRFYQASTSELFGRPAAAPQDETTPFAPVNPYGDAKLLAHRAVGRFRDAFGLFAVCGILYNHESPRRGLEFVTRKITRAVAEIGAGQACELRLGDISARRDWGFAGDYVDAMWLMLQQPEPRDYVIASGTLHSVRDMLEIAFGYVGLAWTDHVRVDPAFSRHDADRTDLVGDPSAARHDLGWRADVGFEDLIRLMVDAELARVGGSHEPRLDWPSRSRARRCFTPRDQLRDAVVGRAGARPTAADTFNQAEAPRAP